MTSGFFAVLDDIVILMDDVLTMTKVSAKKTAGILADDLAVNAEKSSGFSSSRELPVLWAITKGSFLNKLIILPVVFLLSAFLPSIILVVLVIGGIYLSFEGAEKIVDYFYPYEAVSNNLKTDFLSEQALLDLENKKIKSAVLTDFILSIEIIIIALGTVINESFEIKLIVVTLISMLATIGVYGVVGLIVRMDDLGYKLVQASKGRKNRILKTIKKFQKLNEKDINPRRYFYPSLNTLDFVNGNSCLISESLSSRILCLPLFMGLEFKVIDKIIFEINNLI